MSTIYMNDVFETEYNHNPHGSPIQEYEQVKVVVTETRTYEDTLYLKVPEKLIGKPMEFLGEFNGFPIIGYKEEDKEHTEVIFTGPHPKEWGDFLIKKLQEVPQDDRRWSLEYHAEGGFASEKELNEYFNKKRELRNEKNN